MIRGTGPPAGPFGVRVKMSAISRAIESYGLRLERRRLRLRARRKLRELHKVADRTAVIRPGDILLFATVRNERARLSDFLAHYRSLGVEQFLFVDNGSTDGTGAVLADQPDCSVWETSASYRRARYGVDWMNGLLGRYGHDSWTLVVDADEFLVYPHCDTRPLRALTDWLDDGSVRAFSAMLIDLYPKEGERVQGPVAGLPGSVVRARWFDPANYTLSRNPRYGNLWIQGGVRARTFFGADPRRAPALNKIPLVKWRRHYAYVSSTHTLLPRGLNLVYDDTGGEKAAGALLHAKFGPGFADRARAEAARGEHFDGGSEYRAYVRALEEGAALWCPDSQRYSGWRQLESLGLISAGSWA